MNVFGQIVIRLVGDFHSKLAMHVFNYTKKNLKTKIRQAFFSFVDDNDDENKKNKKTKKFKKSQRKKKCRQGSMKITLLFFWFESNQKTARAFDRTHKHFQGTFSFEKNSGNFFLLLLFDLVH